MKPMPWIKLPTTQLNNVALLQLSERAQLRYYQLYLLAGYLNADGALQQDGRKLKEIEIAHLLRLRDPKQLAKDIAAMRRLGLVRVNGRGVEITAFRDEQGDYLKKLEDDRERQRKARERHAGVTRDSGVTDALVTPLEQEQESEQESESEQEQESEQDPAARLRRFVVVVEKSFSDSLGIKINKPVKKFIEDTVNAGHGKQLQRAVEISAAAGKSELRYVRGVLNNLLENTPKPGARKLLPNMEKL